MATENKQFVHPFRTFVLHCIQKYFSYLLFYSFLNTGNSLNSLISMEALWSLMLILEREETRSTRRKTLEAQKRSTIRNSIHMSHQPTRGHTWLFQWHNTLTAWPAMLPCFPLQHNVC